MNLAATMHPARHLGLTLALSNKIMQLPALTRLTRSVKIDEIEPMA